MQACTPNYGMPVSERSGLPRGAPSFRVLFACSIRWGQKRKRVLTPPPLTHSISFKKRLRIKMITVQVNGNEMAWVCENHFDAGGKTLTTHSIETFAWDDDGDLLIKTYYPMPESVGTGSDPYAHLLEGESR